MTNHEIFSHLYLVKLHLSSQKINLYSPKIVIEDMEAKFDINSFVVLFNHSRCQASDFFPYQSTETNHLPHNRYQVRKCVKLLKLGKTAAQIF